MPTLSPSKIVRVVDAKEFVRLVTEKRDTIKDSKIIYPKVGSKSMGKFMVEFAK